MQAGPQSARNRRLQSPRRKEWKSPAETDAQLLEFIPRVSYGRPKVPLPPYVLERTLKSVDEPVTWEEAGFALATLKQPLIAPTGAHPANPGVLESHPDVLERLRQLSS
mmetsp:Transcript_53192/g.124609  ORF Transcript_53192/g.124609 Transcript_53192/m.124609 type:complete len:109 (+) Transcript_53192:212-538(+)